MEFTKTTTLTANFLPTKEEKLLIEEIKKVGNTNEKKAQLLVFSNSLLLSTSDMDETDLYTLLVKNYLLNRPNNIKEIDFAYQSIKNFIAEKDNTSSNLQDFYIKSIIVSLMQFITSDDDIKYDLALDYIKNIGKNKPVDKTDIDACSTIIKALNDINNSNKRKRKNTNSRIYQRKSDR